MSNLIFLFFLFSEVEERDAFQTDLNTVQSSTMLNTVTQLKVPDSQYCTFRLNYTFSVATCKTICLRLFHY